MTKHSRKIVTACCYRQTSVDEGRWFDLIYVSNKFESATLKTQTYESENL